MKKISFSNEGISKFWNLVSKSSDCWEWQGSLSSQGYGSFTIDKMRMSAHRISFAIQNGYIPSSKLDVMHKCDNKKCVNPSHLQLGTRLDNILDFISKGGFYGKNGEKNPASKLTDKQYLELKNRYLNKEPAYKLFKEYGIAHQSFYERFNREQKAALLNNTEKE